MTVKLLFMYIKRVVKPGWRFILCRKNSFLLIGFALSTFLYILHGFAKFSSHEFSMVLSAFLSYGVPKTPQEQSFKSGCSVAFGSKTYPLRPADSS